MGIGCVLFLGAILAAIALAVAGVGAAIFAVAAVRRSKRGMITGGLLGAGAGVVARSGRLGDDRSADVYGVQRVEIRISRHEMRAGRRGSGGDP